MAGHRAELTGQSTVEKQDQQLSPSVILSPHVQIRFPRVLPQCSDLFSAVNTQAFEVPKRAQRVRSLEQAGLQREVAGWDELEQDLLYLRAQKSSVEDLRKKYPKLP